MNMFIYENVYCTRYVHFASSTVILVQNSDDKMVIISGFHIYFVNGILISKNPRYKLAISIDFFKINIHSSEMYNM